ncbi:NAD(P)/FAD-dependent oxidoreductase [Bacillaceae bacterium]
METWDVIVIGGGPAGMMASVAASQQGARVLLLDKGNVLGRKLMISGGGRCNVTNAKEKDEFIKNIPGNGRFMHSALEQFGNKEIIAYFEGLGIRLKEEDRGRMFPVSDKAKTVRDAMLRHMRELGVTIRTNTTVQKVRYENNRCAGVLLANGDRIDAPAVIVAVGGASVPKTGSTGDGYPWAREAGHTIVEPFPAAVPITANDWWIKERILQGLSLRNIAQTLYDPRGKRVTTEEGDMIFTHFGISGPASLRTSRYVVLTLKKFAAQELTLTIDLFPEKSEELVVREARSLCEREPKKAVKNALKGYVPERMVPLLLQLARIEEQTTFHHLARKKLHALARLLKAFPVTVTGTLPLEEATVTGGGVNVREIDPKTMQSKRMPGLFFAGEVMDVDAHTGGYNITVAFSSGYVAGKSAAALALARRLTMRVKGADTMSLEKASRENIETILDTLKAKLGMVNTAVLRAEDFALENYEELLDIYRMVNKKERFSIREIEAIVTELGRLRG